MKSSRDPSAYPANALPLGHTGSHKLQALVYDILPCRKAMLGVCGSHGSADTRVVRKGADLERDVSDRGAVHRELKERATCRAQIIHCPVWNLRRRRPNS